MIKTLYLYRNFVLSAIINDIKSQYSQSSLGFLWMIIYPLIQVLIYSLILSHVISAKLPGVESEYGYSVYLLAGILPWALVSQILEGGTNLFLKNATIIKSVSFPKKLLPVVFLGNSLLNHVIFVICILAILLLLGHPMNLNVLWVPVLSFVAIIFAMSVAFIASIFNVFFRDIGHVVPIFLQIMFWFTPIVYPIAIIPEKYHALLAYNPFYHIVKGFQDCIVFGRAPEPFGLAVLAGISVVLAVFGALLYRRVRPELEDIL